jgi:hypothetical protein
MTQLVERNQFSLAKQGGLTTTFVLKRHDVKCDQFFSTKAGEGEMAGSVVTSFQLSPKFFLDQVEGADLTQFARMQTTYHQQDSKNSGMKPFFKFHL